MRELLHNNNLNNSKENLPFDKVSPNWYAKNLFQGGEHFRHKQTRTEESDQVNRAGRPEPRSQIRSAVKNQESTKK
jgi:hypothetical protein